jgi:hypothetical protein
MSILDAPLISETRRNHGLEHATLHLLAERFPGRSLAGHSNPTGFFVFGDVPTDAVRDAVMQALTRLENGEAHLAVHPGCGTNYIVYGTVTGLLAWLGMGSAKKFRERLERLPLVILLAAAGFVIAQPLALLVQQRITTDGDPAGMMIADIYPVRRGIHRVVTHA